MKHARAFVVGLFALAAHSAHAEVSHPREIIDRPQTTPAHQAMVGTDLMHLFVSEGDSTTGLRVATRYGVNERFELSGSYGFALNEFEAKGDLGFEAAYGLVLGGNLQFAAQARVGYHALHEMLNPITLGVRTKFRVNDRLALYSSGDQLVITIDNDLGETKPTFVQVPVGVGYQVKPSLYAFAETTLAHLEISDSPSEFMFADFLAFAAGGFYTPFRTLDLGASIAWGDLIDDADDLAVMASLRLHL